MIIPILLAKPRRLYQMVDQRSESHEREILNGTLHSFEACALLCMKSENCTSFSYQETTKQFSLSSAFPVYTSNSTTPDFYHRFWWKVCVWNLWILVSRSTKWQTEGLYHMVPIIWELNINSRSIKNPNLLIEDTGWPPRPILFQQIVFIIYH